MNFETKQSLPAYYDYLQDEVRQSLKAPVDYFNEFDKDVLLRPESWFKALAVLELALDSHIEAEETKDFFLLIFRRYDYHASVELNEEDYLWHWNRIHQIIDRIIPYHPIAYVEKALQFISTRRGLVSKEKTLYYLQKGKEACNDIACVRLGYYLYSGFLGETDKIAGMELLNSAQTSEGKLCAAIYKGSIAISEGRVEEAKTMLDELEKENPVPDLIRLIYEQKGYVLEITEAYEEAAAYYQKAYNDTLASGFALIRLAYMHYGKRIEQAKDEPEAIAMMEEALRLGRIDAARSIYFCYNNDEAAWYDAGKALYWLEKGYQYADDYCTAELAYRHLYNEEYKDVEKGLKYLDEAIELNYSGAMIQKAYHHIEGDIVEKDIAKSLEYLDKALANGNGNAAFRAGILYEDGSATTDGASDYTKALAYYEKGAGLDDDQCCGYAGRYYLVGLGTAIDYTKAKAYYERGYRINDPFCIVELGLMHEEGNGMEVDEARAFELYTQASEQNYAHAFYLLGRCYRYGVGTEENPDEAIACFEKAAGQEHAKAQAELGHIYETGYGVEVNSKKAVEYMEQSANLGYAYAEYKMGCYYLYGLEGAIAKHNEKAVEWLTKATDKNHPYAMIEMGDYYLYNVGGSGEQAKAFDYYLKAAGQGCVNEGLGVCYEYGFGVEVNEGEAFKYYLKASEDGYVRAKYYAGICYYFGYGVKENFGEAYRWFNDAANEEHIAATYYKAKMLLAGEGVAQHIEEGIQLLKQAAEADQPDAQFELGNCYLAGKGVDENEALAMEWFEKAADNGHEKALKVTGRRRRK
ncbi:MAG: sel1 repeat family protein [Tannerellaceae bacterium]|jgi:TPR repeat protein|nr:sel1 repeat family protein [Tannerellaceae bacterium]